MAKQIIILERDTERPVRIRFVLWAAVPVARQAFYANPEATSEYRSATQAEIGALQDGSVVERVDTLSLPANATVAQIRAALLTAFNRYQNEITNANPWDFYGTFYDGTSWTQQGVS